MLNSSSKSSLTGAGAGADAGVIVIALLALVALVAGAVYLKRKRSQRVTPRPSKQPDQFGFDGIELEDGYLDVSAAT